MKSIHGLTKKTIFCAYLTGICYFVMAWQSLAFGQAITQCSPGVNDTVTRRNLKCRLLDSTLIRFRVGPYGLKTLSGSRYLGFQSLTSSDSCVKSAAFVSGGTGDTISIARMVTFDSKNPVRISDTVSDSMRNALASAAASQLIIPVDSIFTLGSTILFVTELRKYSDNSVYTRLDTLTCYKDSLVGALHYCVSGCTPVRVAVPLPLASSGDTVYIGVRVLLNLPTLSTVSYQKVDETNGANPSVTPLYGAYQQCNGGPAFKRANSEALPKPIRQSQTVGLGIAAISGIDGTLISLTFNADLAGSLGVSVYDILGHTVLPNKTVEVTTGSNSTSVDLSGLQRGPYFIVLDDNGSTKKTFRVDAR